MKSLLYKTRFIWVILLAIGMGVLLSGCTTPVHTRYARLINRLEPRKKKCLRKAQLFVKLMGGEVYCNKTHAFMVKDGKIYDADIISLTGYPIDHWRVQRAYGDKGTWYIYDKETMPTL